MQVYFIEVRYGNIERGIEKVFRYAVLSKSSNEALETVSIKLGHGGHARLMDNPPSVSEVAHLDLLENFPKILY